MGRASRRRRQARERAIPSGSRRGLKADARGRRIPSTIAGYEDAASNGIEAVREALIWRHNLRMARIAAPTHAGFAPLRSVVTPAGHLMIAVSLLGARADRLPALAYGEWVDQIAWGVDSIFSAARLEFAGQAVGAALVARSQLERWSESLAFNGGVTVQPGESVASRIERIWMLEDSPEAVSIRKAHAARFGSPISFGNGRRIAKIYGSLSELMHGRGPHLPVTRWDACYLLDPAARPPATGSVQMDLAETLALVVRRLRSCVSSLAIESNNPKLRALAETLPLTLPAGSNCPPAWSLWPLVPRTGLAEDVRNETAKAHTLFESVKRGERPLGRLFRDNEMMDITFVAYRARAIEAALYAFQKEEELRGHPLNLDSVGAREGLYVLASEMAGIYGLWFPNSPSGDASATACSALRSAYWLWLEDDDRAMGMLRIVLEQTARMRTWRLKPNRAERLENSGRSTPRDWIESAGLRRLTAMSRAFGEFAHFRVGSRWLGSRDLLDAIQHPNYTEEHSEYTGRRSALDQVSGILGYEVAASLNSATPVIAAAFTQILGKFEAISAKAGIDFDKYLDHVGEQREFAMGDPTFSGPASGLSRFPELFGSSFTPYSRKHY